MLRVAVARATAGHVSRRQAARQWLPQRVSSPSFLAQRHFADNRPVDKTVVPSVQPNTVAGVPQDAIEATITSNRTPSSPEIPPAQAPKVPPTPEAVGSTAAFSAPPPPERPRRRLRSLLLSLIVLASLSYAGGVYYSLVSDNFHDFFTEYVPYGEDAVGYFEEREFRKRFPPTSSSSVAGTKTWPQSRGESKVTIARQSGMQPRVAQVDGDGGSDLGSKGKHVREDKKPAAPTEDKKPSPPAKVKDDSSKLRQSSTTENPARGEAMSQTPAQNVSTIDHISVPQAEDPIVQDLVKLVNNVIIAVNASNDAGKLAPVITAAKDELHRAITQIAASKEQAASETDVKLKDAHTEFDNAAKELVRRVEAEMHEQESRWREEYELERERLSENYQHKLATELHAAQKVAEEKHQNALLEQEIALQQVFTDSVKTKVESEREGRLSKLDELSSSVTELEQLTSEWNTVVEATMHTQHLQVALEAVRTKLHNSDQPTPFLNELVALKEVSNEDDAVNAAIFSIPPVAYQLGIPSIASLIDRFRRVATEVRKASLLPADAGVTSHAASAVLSRLMFQKKAERGLPEGDDVEATLARTEVLLEESDLDAAVREMNGLKGWAGLLSKDWVTECRRVLEVQQAIDLIATAARLQSLMVE